MAISGIQPINVGVENQATGSDSLFVAFGKTQNNFAILANTASPYNTFRGGNGIVTESFTSNGTVAITNTGVINIVAGTGITASGSNGNVTLSVSGSANGNIVAGVTSVGISSQSLTVANSPIISSGLISVELPNVVTPGSYTAPTVTVDSKGRITSIANTVSTGTVTSVTIANGAGIQIVGDPITTSGTITVVNTGVTRLNAGPGISLSSSTGELTISTSSQVFGTVTSVEVTSNTLVVTGSPITSTGTINIEMPETDTMTGTFTAGNLISNSALRVLGNANVVGTFTATGNVVINANANITGTFNVTGNANISSNITSAYFIGNGATLASITGANVTGTVANATFATTAATVTTGAQPNITSTGTLANVTSTGNIDGNNISAATYLRTSGGLLLDSDNGKYVALSAQPGVSANYVWGLPVADGASGSFMSTNGSGTLTFSYPASSSAPASAVAPGTAGQIAYDSTHIYVCIATNTWIRASAATW